MSIIRIKIMNFNPHFQNTKNQDIVALFSNKIHTYTFINNILPYHQKISSVVGIFAKYQI